MGVQEFRDSFQEMNDVLARVEADIARIKDLSHFGMTEEEEAEVQQLASGLLARLRTVDEGTPEVPPVE